MTNTKQIVVGIDYSEGGLLALRRARDLASGGALHVVHAVEPLAAAFPPGLGQAIPSTVSLSEQAAILTKYVEEQLASPGESPPPARIVSHVAVGAPPDQIVQLASDLEADLVVVGTHGRRGVSRLLLGSTAERVVRWAPCPVLVERPKAPLAEVPKVEPPCPRCVEARRATGGQELWCEQHRERHGRRHTYHIGQRPAAFPSPHGGLGSVS